MSFHLQRSGLRDLYEKVVAGERISESDALRLFESKDLNAVGAIADFVRQRKVGERASYIVNRYINYSNYCILSCQFCSFARKKRDADGFELTTRIRGDSTHTDLPVVLVTALEAREDKERGLRVGANAYVLKSTFDQSNLLEIIGRLI